MVSIGYALSSEEHRPRDLIRYAQRAEETGFSFALISDHYHPWTDKQGQSAFVWDVLGAISQATRELQVGTGVTCPILRVHPAIIAQAAATTADLFEGRFFLGVGTGENLNEHVLGDAWPPPDVRLEMLEEAIDVIRTLWQGGLQRYRGEYFVVDQAQIYTLPDALPPIMVAASGPRSMRVAGSVGDGLIGLAPQPEMIQKFQDAGGQGKPRIGMTHVCWAPSEAEAKRITLEHWPNSALQGSLGRDLKLPRDIEAACAYVSEDDAVQHMAIGPDPQPYIEYVQTMADAGFDHVYVHQVGPDQDGFFEFYGREVLPALQAQPASIARGARTPVGQAAV